MLADAPIVDPLGFLGLQSDTAQVQELFQDYGIPTAPKVEPDEPQPVRFWLPIRRLGIEFGFTKADYHLATPSDEEPNDLLICTTIYFYNWPSSGIARYSGGLPHDLRFSMTRAEVQEAMRDNGLTPSSYERDVYADKGNLCIVSYAPKENAISDIIMRIPDKPFPPTDLSHPDYQGIVDLFGQSVRDPRFVEAFGEFDLESRLEELKDEREISLRDEAGLDLVFSWGRLLKLKEKTHGLVFAGVRFYRPREQNAVGWAGSLPGDMTFESSPRTVLDTFGRAPDQHAEDDQSGYFVWQRSVWTGHVRFNKVENNIRRFSIYAPGYWDSRSNASIVEGRRSH